MQPVHFPKPPQDDFPVALITRIGGGGVADRAGVGFDDFTRGIAVGRRQAGRQLGRRVISASRAGVISLLSGWFRKASSASWESTTPSRIVSTTSARTVAARLRDPLIYYFEMLGERFTMRQARALITFALIKPSDLTGGTSARSCNPIIEDRLTY